MNERKGMDLQERLAYLEGINRSRMQALEMIRDLSDFQDSVNKLEDPRAILRTCRDQVAKLLQIRSAAFYLIDEDSADFELYDCHPEAERETIRTEVDRFIDDATFSRALIEKKPVTASTKDFNTHYLFHVLATVSRVRGMFVAQLEGSVRKVPEAAFELLSILMTHCANALESYELYHRLELSNQALEEKVDELSRSRNSLRQEVAAHKKTLGALRESESQYRLLAETAQEIIITVTLDWQVAYVNSSGLFLGGYEPKDLGDVHRIFNGLDRVLASEDPYHRRHRIFMVNRSGDEIPVEISLARVRLTGREERILIVGRDISDQIQAEKEKADLEERLWQARKMESIGLLAGGTAHDFNNLLSVICNYTDMALDQLRESDPVHRYLTQVETASRDAIALARQLYTIGREDVHETHRVELNRLIKKTLKLLRSSLGKQLDLSWELGEEALFVMAEDTRIRQVLMNLITNAAHAMDTGAIVIGAERYRVGPGPAQMALGVDAGSFVRIWVQDTGPGIDPEVLPHIFDPYFSTKATKDNAGLGLAVVHGIIKNYNGAIEVESSPNAGACFYVYLPEAAALPQSSPALSHPT